MEINKLLDLNRFKSAPDLNNIQKSNLLYELDTELSNADWITVGIMAKSDKEAIFALNSISNKYSSIDFKNIDSLKASGNVFLKGNQKTRNVYIRSENGLGEGILLTCQYEGKTTESKTFGPFPLDFFRN